LQVFIEKSFTHEANFSVAVVIGRNVDGLHLLVPPLELFLKAHLHLLVQHACLGVGTQNLAKFYRVHLVHDLLYSGCHVDEKRVRLGVLRAIIAVDNVTDVLAVKLIYVVDYSGFERPEERG
jgi:hypothetical protein